MGEWPGCEMSTDRHRPVWMLGRGAERSLCELTRGVELSIRAARDAGSRNSKAAIARLLNTLFTDTPKIGI